MRSVERNAVLRESLPDAVVRKVEESVTVIFLCCERGHCEERRCGHREEMKGIGWHCCVFSPPFHRNIRQFTPLEPMCEVITLHEKTRVKMNKNKRVK